jgi:arylsulfatase A-like enzyme
MGSPDAPPLSDLDADAVENVFVFVADAVRWDALPDRVADRGLTCRTAASALMTPQSMPSLITGLYPPGHGVTWFDQSLPASVRTLLDARTVEGSFVDSKLRRPLAPLLGDPRERDVETAEPPFVHVELDHGGHAPYPSMAESTPQEIFAAFSRQPAALRERYDEGVAESVDRFERRLAQLEDRGLLEETLVVFASDHGELLGEHGGVAGHSLPPTPELVYVPTTFVHPSLPAGRRAEAFVQHVDLAPTIADLLDVDLGHDPDGRSLLDPLPSDRRAYVNGTVRPARRWHDTVLDPVYDAPSVWTEDGGYVFARSSLAHRALTATYEALWSGYTGAYNSDRSRLATLATAARRYLPRTATFGDPAVDRATAREFCESVRDRDVVAGSSAIDDATQRRLEDLGYV